MTKWVGVLTVASLGAAGMAGAASTGAAATPAARPAATISQRVDIDGDKRRDTLRITRLAPKGDTERFRVSVRTATGKTASTIMHIEDYLGGGLTSTGVFTGTAPLDGTRGDEILMDRSANVGEGEFIRVLTWRSGTLVVLPEPGSGRIPEWGTSSFPRAQTGYTFSTAAGKRQVVVHQVKGSTVTNTRYQSQGTTWKKLATSRATVTPKQANALARWKGVTITKRA